MTAVRRFASRAWVVGLLVLGSAVPALFHAQAASAASCSSPSYSWASGTSKTFTPGNFCVTRYGYELLFGVEGDLILYGNDGNHVWDSGTTNFGTKLVLGTGGRLNVDGCQTEACPKIVNLWNSVDSAEHPSDFSTFMVQIGENVNTDDACWAMAAYNISQKAWYGGSGSWPGSGLCAGTYSASGGGGGGYG
jgi:hypothetical protein